MLFSKLEIYEQYLNNKISPFCYWYYIFCNLNQSDFRLFSHTRNFLSECGRSQTFFKMLPRCWSVIWWPLMSFNLNTLKSVHNKNFTLHSNPNTPNKWQIDGSRLPGRFWIWALLFILIQKYFHLYCSSILITKH